MNTNPNQCSNPRLSLSELMKDKNKVSIKSLKWDELTDDVCYVSICKCQTMSCSDSLYTYPGEVVLLYE